MYMKLPTSSFFEGKEIHIYQSTLSGRIGPLRPKLQDMHVVMSVAALVRVGLEAQRKAQEATFMCEKT